MKNIFLSLTFLLSIVSINSSFAKTLIVSDVDDTIKVTNVLNARMKVINGLFSKKSFSGMSELYQQLNSRDSNIYYVSGSPNIIRTRINSFLKFNNFPKTENLILKQGQVATYDYKLAAIRGLVAKYNPDKIILVGDDTEVDPEVYHTLAEENPGKMEGIYIRAIRNRALPANALIKSFFAPVEVAGLELLKGNFSVEGLNLVASSFIKQDHSSKVVIKGRYCPTDGRDQIEELKHQVREQSSIDSLEDTQQKIIATCKR